MWGRRSGPGEVGTACRTRSARTVEAAQEGAAESIEAGVSEARVQAAIDYIFAEGHAVRAFPSIVGSGKNSTILHYVDNKDVLKDGNGTEFNMTSIKFEQDIAPYIFTKGALKQ